MPHNIPIAIENGSAPITGQTLRQFVYSMIGGVDGVYGPTDCQITALSTPAGQVQALPGRYAIINRAAGAQSEAYQGGVSTADVVAVAPTTSSGGRADLVVYRVLNPVVESVTPPSDLAAGPYVQTVIIQGVPAGTVSHLDLPAPYNTWTAITAARINIPVSTSAIQQSYITDLRSSAIYGTRITDGQLAQNPQFYVTTLDSGDYLYKTDNASWKDWPAQASWSVAVPAWATVAKIFLADLNPLVERFDTNNSTYANVWGSLRVSIGSGGNVVYTTPVIFDVNVDMRNASSTSGSGGERPSMTAAATVALPAAIRGGNRTFKLQGIMTNSNLVTGHIKTGRGTVGRLGVQFDRTPTAA